MSQAKVRIEDLTSENVLDFLSPCFHPWLPPDPYVSDPAWRSAMQISVDWLTRMRSQGLRGKILYEHDVPIGLIEYMPVQHAPMPLKGEGALVLMCLHVDRMSADDPQRRGYGTRLLEEAKADAASTSMPLVVLPERLGIGGQALQEMTSYFVHRGFAWVGVPGGRLLAHGDTSDMRVRYVPRRWTFRPVPGKVAVDVFWDPGCPHRMLVLSWLMEVERKMGGKVLVRAHNLAAKQVMEEVGDIRWYFIDGEPGPASWPPTIDVFRRAIEDAAKRADPGESRDFRSPK